MIRKAVSAILVLIMTCSLFAGAATPAAFALPAQGDRQDPACFEQEVSAPADEKGLKASPWVVGATLAVVAAALFFVVIKKSSNEGQNTRIQVNSDPDGARIFMDGQETGQLTDCTFSNVTPGYHNVKLVKEGYVAQVVSVTVVRGQTAVIDVTLVRE